jgi:hypothetical protein
MGHVHVESDCTNLIKAIQEKEFDLAPEGIIFRDIRSFVQLNFISFKFSYYPRACNKIAHALAAIGAKQVESRLVWIDSIPDSVNVLMASELTDPS